MAAAVIVAVSSASGLVSRTEPQANKSSKVVPASCLELQPPPVHPLSCSFCSVLTSGEGGGSGKPPESADYREMRRAEVDEELDFLLLWCL